MSVREILCSRHDEFNENAGSNAVRDYGANPYFEETIHLLESETLSLPRAVDVVRATENPYHKTTAEFGAWEKFEDARSVFLGRLEYQVKKDHRGRCRVKVGWDTAGRVGYCFCCVHVEETLWAVIQWDDEEDPVMFKEAGIEKC